MSLTILFDMDDTLLSNKMEDFLPVYIQSLAAAVSQVPAKQFVAALLHASEEMVRKPRANGTLESTFDQYFYPAIGFSKSQIRDSIDSFYQDIYPSLNKVTSPKPDAQKLVKEMLNDGHQIVIATNPLFPQTAISQRLNWAGFEQTKVKFKIITSYENFHFSKPHPEYFAEILAQLGWPDQPAVMIGNSFKEDIIPSEMAGLFAFYLADEPDAQDVTMGNPLSALGKMGDILPWLDRIANELPPFPRLSSQGLNIALSVTPSAVDTLAQSIYPENHQGVLSLIKNAVTFDYQLANMPDVKLLEMGSIETCCQSFFNSRESLLKLSTGLMDHIDHQELFNRDRALLRSLIELRN